MLHCLLSACFLADIPVSLFFFHTMMNDVYHLIAVHEIIWFIVFTLGVTMLKLYCRLISTQWSSPQFLRICFSIVCVITSWVASSTFTQINIHSDDHFGHVHFFYLVLQSFPSTLTQTQKWKFSGACSILIKSNVYVWFLINLAINNPTVPSFTCRMARVCLQLCPMVGISCCELAEVWPSPPGGALWGAAARSPPPAPAHHSLSKRHYDRGEVSVCREQPRRAFQTLRGSAALFWPIHSRHETDDWLPHSCCWPGAAEQEL